MKKEISVNYTDLTSIVKAIVSPETFSTLDAITLQNIPPLAYTSFDGDNLSYSELMKQHVLKSGIIPLNPESALGTYIVTNFYNGDKRPIIEDCLSLINLTDTFYVMSKSMTRKPQDIKHLPEGVIAEILYWSNKKDHVVHFVDISDFSSDITMTCKPELIADLHESQQAGIKSVLSSEKNLRKTAYLLAGEMHAKHSDWMRHHAYTQEMVPLCPYTLINYSTLYLHYKGDAIKQLLARLAFSTRADSLLLYSPYEAENFMLNKLPVDALLELYVTCKLRPDIPVIHTFFGEIGVPKYVNRQKWAITAHEKIQQG